MNFLNSVNSAIDKFFDFIDPIHPNKMSPDYAAYIIQRTYRQYLIKKYFKHMKYCTPPIKQNFDDKKGWFF